MTVTRKDSEGDMPYRRLGSTGELVSAIGVGGAHLGHSHVDEQLSIRIIRSAIDRGVTFMDNSWDYNQGASEKRMGKALADGYREKVFLMTKVDGRSKKEAARQLDQSLDRLGVDYVDLVQHHEVLRFEDPDRIFREDGANAALMEARQAGKLRYIGFTGHKDPRIHLYMLQTAEAKGFSLDTVQMPINLMDAHFRSFEKNVLPELTKRHIGVLAMKTMANGLIPKSTPITPIECIHYALNLPVSVVITGIDSMEVLEQAVTAARTFQPMNEDQVSRLLEKSRPFAANGDLEPFKTTTIHDMTAQDPSLLGPESFNVYESA